MQKELQLWAFIRERIERRESVMLLVVAESSGSSPGRAGYKMVVAEGGELIGSIGGGWLSSTLMKRGWSVNAARKTTMLLCALCVVPIIFAAKASTLWVAVGLVSLATSAHQGWSG